MSGGSRGAGVIRVPAFLPTLEKELAGGGFPGTTGRPRRLRDLGGLASGLDADDLARTGLNKAAREEIRALRAERAFVQARLNVLSRVAENLQERERELTGKEWGPDDFEESGPGSSGSSGGEEQDDAEGDPDAEYEEAGGKKKDAKTKAKVKAKATRGGGKPKGK